MTANDNSKAAIRERMRELLRAVNREDRTQAGAVVAAAIAPHLPAPSAGAMMGYMPMWEEFDAEPIMQGWLDAGGVLASPVVNWAGGTMVPGRLGGLKAPHIRMGLRGVREPVSDEALDIANVAAVIVPALAFDREGRRLGRGGGFYDRFLGDLPNDVLRIGVCFDEQIIRAVPVEGHDRRVHLIASPTEVLEAR